MIFDIAWYGIQAAELLAGAAIVILAVVSVSIVLRWRSLQFNYVWGFRAWLSAWSALWIVRHAKLEHPVPVCIDCGESNCDQIAFFLQLEFLWSPSWGFFRVSGATQAQFCLCYVTLFHGLAEPAFLAGFVFLVTVHARCELVVV
jgi:hypothetical protein